MTTGIENWTLKDWLESAAYAVAVLAAVAGAIIFLANNRRAAIEATRKELARAWTNEGDVTSQETAFIDLQLENHDGDIIGTLHSPRREHPLEVHADIGWRSTELTISELRGRSLSYVATVQVQVAGNQNRLQWRVTSVGAPSYLPASTELWPNQLGPASAQGE